MAKWYNAVQTQVALAKCTQESVKILHRDIIYFFLRDEDFFLNPSMIVTLTSTSFLQIR